MRNLSKILATSAFAVGIGLGMAGPAAAQMREHFSGHDGGFHESFRSGSTWRGGSGWHRGPWHEGFWRGGVWHPGFWGGVSVGFYGYPYYGYPYGYGYYPSCDPYSYGYDPYYCD